MSCIITIRTNRNKLYKKIYKRESASARRSPDVSTDEMCEFIFNLIKNNRKEDTTHG